MFHLEWLLPILLAFWILVNLIRKTEEERRNRERSTPNGERPPSPPPPRARRTNADIDRFLEEVNRRRGQAGERRPSPGAETRPPTPRRPVPPPPRGEPPAPVQQPAPPAVEAVFAIPVAEPVLPRSRLAAGRAREAKVVAARPAGPSPALLDLLRSKESIRTAFILQEILSPPLCHRATGRHLRAGSP
jgi:hypothetical protein